MTTLLYSGNMGLGHELETVIRAIYKLDQAIELKVLFVGNGKAQRSIEKLTVELGLDNIEFRPPVPLFKLPSILAAGDIHLVSQKPGTQGLLIPSKIYGVLAAGRPTLFIGPSDCELAMIISKSRAGVVVQPGDIEGTAIAIKNLALNPEMRREMGRRARRYYDAYFGRDRSVSRIIKAIEAIACL